MPATFAPITDRTDRPRLFDDRPSRARRPARRQPPVAPRDPAEPTRAPSEPLFPPAPDRTPREPGATARGPLEAPERARREPDSTARGPLDAPTAPAPHDTAPAPQHHDHAPDAAHHGGGSLDDLLRGVWDELSSHRTVTCPVCHGQMAPRYGSAEQPVGGRCRRCGSSLG
jgi:hypothetical protein